mmetsp:Transcript_22562/g.36870  ORF Transcript_22562/g.36870 Transcript_22562/m.36870 type:complete len:388 (+) Transcript_22562:207-1370(+)
MVAVSLLHGLGKLRPHDAILLSNGPEAFCHAALHTFQAAHVDMRLLILHQLPEFFRILGHLGLDVHLLSCRILVLTAHGVVVAELIWEFLLVSLVLIIIQQRFGVWHAHEEPCQALELAAIPISSSLVMEEQPQIGAHGCDASASGQHDDVGFRICRQQHLGSGGTGDQHVISNAHVANVVGANSAVDLVVWESGACLVGLVLSLCSVAELAIQLHHSLHAQRNSLGGLIISHSRGGDGVQTDPGWLLALLVRARRDDTNGLPLDVRHLATVVEGHMGGLPVGITSWLRESLRVEVVLNDLALVGCLGGEQVPWNLLAVDHLHTLLLHSSSIAAGGSAPSSSSCHGDACQAGQSCSAGHTSTACTACTARVAWRCAAQAGSGLAHRP